LREEEKLSNKSQRQLLEAFNQDRDGLRAKHERLQEEKADLQEEITRKEELTKAHEAIRKQQADQIQSLKRSEETMKEDLGRSHNQVQGLIRAIEAEKQKGRSLQASLDAQEAKLTNTTAELQQLNKMHQTLQHRAEWDAKELQTIAALSIPLIEESPR
jgi:chromosome segregation ATPase